MNEPKSTAQKVCNFWSDLTASDIEDLAPEEKEYQIVKAEIEQKRRETEASISHGEAMSHELKRAEEDQWSGEYYELRDHQNRRKRAFLSAMLEFEE